MKISVIGLGKLGLPLAATLASKDFKVIGVDKDKRIVNNLNKAETLSNEPKLKSLIKKNKTKITATTDTYDAVINTNATFIVVPTPSEKSGALSLKFVEQVANEIAKALKDKSTYHLVILTSSIMPGATEKVKIRLEEISQKDYGIDFGLCYSPELIALGSVIKDLLNPDFVIIGQVDKKSGYFLEFIYQQLCDNNPPFAKMNFINAEIAKIALNTFVTTKISYANMLAEICEKLPGGDVDEVTSAIGLDSRIGIKYLKGGPAYGGPCFPRDNLAFIALAKKLGSSSKIANSTHQTNLRQTKRLLSTIDKNSDKNSKVGILGLSYKPDTDVFEESQGFLLAEKLIKRGVKAILYDPLALENMKHSLGNKAQYCKSARECIGKSDVIVITTNWPEFVDIKNGWFGKNRKVLIDPWRMIDSHQLPINVKYVPLGRSQN